MMELGVSTMDQSTTLLPNFTHSPIDVHSHFNHGSKFDCPETEAHIRDINFIESVYRRVGVTQVGISTFASVTEPTCVSEENEYLHRLIEEKDWVYQWVVIDPRQKETYAQAQRMLTHPKVLGIKLHPAYHGYRILDYAQELFAFANSQKTVVLIHPQYEISSMRPFADKCPDMKLILAHLDSTRFQEYTDTIIYAEYGNIYTDTSGRASAANNVIEGAVQRVGSQKILFGTDTYSYAFQFGRIALSALSTEEKENILWKNATRLFPNAFSS